jgi:hypothetical protein
LPQRRITADTLPGRQSPNATKSARSRARWASRLPGLGPLLREGRIKPPERLPKGATPPLTPGSPGGRELVASPVVTTDGSGPVRLDALRGTSFALVGVGVDPEPSLTEASRALWRRAGYSCIAVPADQLPTISPGSVVIVRPDHFVRDIVRASDLNVATAALFAAAVDTRATASGVSLAAAS